MQARAIHGGAHACWHCLLTEAFCKQQEGLQRLDATTTGSCVPEIDFDDSDSAAVADSVLCERASVRVGFSSTYSQHKHLAFRIWVEV